MWKRLLQKHIRIGTLKLLMPDGEVICLGEGGPVAVLRIHRPRCLLRIAVDPGMQLGETYVQGDWDAEEGGLLQVMEFMFRNLVLLEQRKGLMTQLRRSRHLLAEWNTAWRSRRNVSHHYDLNESLYRRFLDADMQYSCAYFERPGMRLEQAQQAKCRHIARKLLLQPGQRVLDVGSGWGGLALYLAREYNVEVTGLTLSKEQLRVSSERARAAGLQKPVQFKLEDYRQHQGHYDAIVSVGMFEHVGRPHYPDYFAVMQRLLKRSGHALLHTIGHTGRPTASNPWMQKYIFPGSYLPALSEIMPAVEGSGMVLADTEVWHTHYADTLAEWHRRFQRTRPEIAHEMGERFCRIWAFYLQACEASFRWYDFVVFQLQLTRESRVAPRTRGYLYESEGTESTRFDQHRVQVRKPARRKPRRSTVTTDSR